MGTVCRAPSSLRLPTELDRAFRHIADRGGAIAKNEADLDAVADWKEADAAIGRSVELATLLHGASERDKACVIEGSLRMLAVSTA